MIAARANHARDRLFLRTLTGIRCSATMRRRRLGIAHLRGRITTRLFRTQCDRRRAAGAGLRRMHRSRRSGTLGHGRVRRRCRRVVGRVRGRGGLRAGGSLSLRNGATTRTHSSNSKGGGQFTNHHIGLHREMFWNSYHRNLRAWVYQNVMSSLLQRQLDHAS